MQKDIFASNPASTPIASVSDFVLLVRKTLEASIPLGWITGEISNLTRASSGHLYFTIKDDRAQIRCTMWRNRAQLLPFQLTEGMQVEVRAQVTIYEARGDLQLSIESIRRAGAGTLYETFLRLKAKLETEGLFDDARKRPLPAFPRAIGIVTSPNAAALHDVLTTLQRRAKSLPLVLYPTSVQGDGAGELIAGAIRTAGDRAAQDQVDLLIVCRGGGSIEDLWAFNHEAVVRNVAACPIPVVSGVGHETDTTLCDFAADIRAATPTAAAELVSAPWLRLNQQLPSLNAALSRTITRQLNNRQQRLDEFQRRLVHPATRLARSAERLDMLEKRFKTAIHTSITRRSMRLTAAESRIKSSRPNLTGLRPTLAALGNALQREMHIRLIHAQTNIAHLATHLQHLNPAAVLQRGYAIVRDQDGSIVRDASSLCADELLDIQFSTGHAKAKVVKSEN